MWLATNARLVSMDQQKGGTTVKEQHFEWSFQFDVIKELFEDFCRLDKFDFLNNYDQNCVIHFLRAGDK
jgi:hypothetical protein